MHNSNLRIFIVDDAYDITQILYECLKSFGYENVECFTNPITAYSTICNKNINFKNAVILSDQNMPRVKGEVLLDNLQSVTAINAAIITSEPGCVTSNKYPIFEKGASDFFPGICKYLESLPLNN